MFFIHTLGYEDKFHLEPAEKNIRSWAPTTRRSQPDSVLYCQKRNKNQTNPVLGNFTAPILSCHRSVFSYKKCFQFRWIPCQRPNLVAHVKHNTDIQKFQYLFDAISSPINVFVYNLSNFVTVRIFIKTILLWTSIFRHNTGLSCQISTFSSTLIWIKCFQMCLKGSHFNQFHLQWYFGLSWEGW